MEIYLIIAQIIGTYVVSAVMLYSDGAYGALARFRNKETVMRFGLFHCFLCVSFWSALIFSILAGGNWLSFFIVWGGAYIIDQLIMAYKTK